jgi:threonine synthase
MIGVQAAAAAPLVEAFRRGSAFRPVAHPETIATAIRIGAPVNWRKALAALVDSHGDAGTVTDREILDAQRHLARTEGIFVEPASATPLAFLRRRRLPRARTVVLVTTGHGLKDPDAVLRGPIPMKRIPATLGSLRRLLGR